jgi:HEAT repeat protein
VHAQESLRGAAQPRLVDLARHIGAEGLAVELLDSGEPRKELLSLIALGHMRLRSTLPLAESLIGAASPVISIAAAHVLLRIDAAAMLDRVVETAARRPDWPLPKLAAMLAECGADEAGAALASAIDAQLRSPGPESALVRLLRLTDVANAEMMRPVVLRVLERGESPEAVAAALGALWHPDDADWARRCAGHAQWFVRVTAAKTLARIGTSMDRDLLTRMLSDPHWWVRYRAAQALARLPGMGRGELRRLRDSLGDRFAADMLAQVIAEQGAP